MENLFISFTARLLKLTTLGVFKTGQLVFPQYPVKWLEYVLREPDRSLNRLLFPRYVHTASCSSWSTCLAVSWLPEGPDRDSELWVGLVHALTHTGRSNALWTRSGELSLAVFRHLRAPCHAWKDNLNSADLRNYSTMPEARRWYKWT